MSASQLLSQFDRVAEAPEAIPRLRILIRDLAARGRLVEQDPKDEPASELLRRNEVVRLGLEGGRKGARVRPDAAPAVESQPYQVPPSWEWVHFATIAEYTAGRTPPRHDTTFWNTGDYPWVSIADMPDRACVLTTKETVSEKARQQVFASGPSAAGTLIMSFKLTIGKIARLGCPAFHNEAIVAIHPYLRECEPYLFEILPQFARQGDTKGAIKGATLNRESIGNIMLPMPPLAEQKRIVAFLAELMARCDRLETAQIQRELERDRAAAASLNRLNEMAENEEEAFRVSARLHLRSLPQLSTRVEHIKHLRQSVTKLAVCGRVVPQIASEGSAASLIDLLEAERTRGVEEGLFREQERIPGSDSTAVISVPESWRLLHLADVVQLRSGIALEHGEEMPVGEIPYVKVADLGLEANRNGIVTSSRFIRASSKHKRALIPAGSIVFPKRGGAIATNKKRRTYVDIVCDSNLMAMKPFLSELLPFLQLWFTSIDLWKLNSGTSVPQVNNKDIYPIRMPLPPLAEQHRIVAKVDEILSLCDRLEVQLMRNQREEQLLLELALSQALKVEHSW